MLGRGDQHQHHAALLDRRLRAGRLRLHRRARERGRPRAQPIDRIASVASFFVSRVDTLVDKLLDEKIAATERCDAEGLIEVAQGQGRHRQRQARLRSRSRTSSAARAWDASQRQARDRSARSGPAPAPRTRPTPDTLYVDHPDRPGHGQHHAASNDDAAFLDHGTVERTVDKDLDQRPKTMADLAAAGIDIDAVTAQLEDEGIASFSSATNRCSPGVAAKRSQLAGAPAD